MNRKSSICCMALATSCLLGITNVEASIILNGEKLKQSTQTKVVGGTTLVPIRIISEQLGAEVHYEPTTEKIYITKDNREIILTVNSKETIVDKVHITLTEKVIKENGTTFVPLRFIAENLECTITYDPTVYFDGKNIESVYEIKSEYYEDITNDGVEDHIVIRGDRNDWDTNDMITFYDGKTGEVLTSINDYSLDVYIEEDSFFDITGDGIKDFILYLYSGGTAGGSYDVLIYKDGTYVGIDREKGYPEFEILDNFECRYRHDMSGKCVVKQFTKAQQEKLIGRNLYTNTGTLLEKNYWIRNGGVGFKDVDGDGIAEYIQGEYVKSFAYDDVEIFPTSIYKYVDGMLKLSDLDINIE